MSSNTLQNLVPGSKVTIKRNLDHPAWMKEVPADPRNGSGTKLVRDDSVAEVIGQGEVIDVNTYGIRPSVRVSNGFWYTLADGLQDGSKSTRIEAVATDPKS